MDCRSSKRGRGTKDTGAATTKKEAKVVVRKAEEVVGERKEGVEGFVVVDEAAELRWSGVEEEMPWATCWFPFWEVQATVDALYGDVWDYDIWGFKAAHNFAPNK